MKNVLVTRGTKGIGAAISEALCKDGFRVAAIFNSDRKAADHLTEKVQSSHLKVLQTDVSDYAAVQELAIEVKAVKFLIENDFVTGQTIHINGGLFFTQIKSPPNMNFLYTNQT